MGTLHVPALTSDARDVRLSFRRHYRSLIVNSLLESAEEELARHRAEKHRLRAWRAERTARRARMIADHVDDLAAPRGFGIEVRLLATAALPICATLLIANVVAFGIRSWTNTAAEIAMITLTLIWFVVKSFSSNAQGAQTEAVTEDVPESASESASAAEPEKHHFSDEV